MFWADKIAEEVKKRGKSLEWVDDMKTPSGRIHVGGLRAVATHDLIYKSLLDNGVNAKSSYVFDNHDPMDSLPAYLPKEKYEKYLGVPLYQIPSPEEGAENYAEFYAKDFIRAFNKIGCNPEIIWGTELYFSGKMNEGIKKCLDNAEKIRKIYGDLYGKPKPQDWYPFVVYCPKCNKVSTTAVTDWDGKEVIYECRVDELDWTKGCGHQGKMSPFATKDKIHGKIPWKVEWAVKWQAIGVTVEGAGKDHMTAGGSHDLAKRVAKEILQYNVPSSFSHEFFLTGGKKMSSSKGQGSSAAEMVEILPPEILRFLIAKTRLNQAINFDPAEPNTIPYLFDDYQLYAEHFFGKKADDYARIFEVSQVGDVKKPPKSSFMDLIKILQDSSKKEVDEREEWLGYARIWIEKYAPKESTFAISENLPEESKSLNEKQKEYLRKIAQNLERGLSPEKFEKSLYEEAKEAEISSKEAFLAIYISLAGKKYGPKASELILGNKDTAKKRFEEVSA